MTWTAIIVAAGRGTRAGGEIPKQWQLLGAQPVLAHTIRAFEQAAPAEVVLVLNPDDMGRARTIAPQARLVPGGETRAQSVRNALEALADTPPDHVLIHDGARPMVSPILIGRVLTALEKAPGAAPAVPVTDALWRGQDGVVGGTVARDGLWRAQTPQGFSFAAILDAHRAHPGDAADDVAVARAAGLDVTIVEGEEDNLKITLPADFARAARLLGGHMDIRLGNGFDVHRFGPGDGVWLCGVYVPHPRGLQGHSDADVGMHALTDAIYGALADGDIGQHFPPSDPQWKGAESHIFLRHAAERARDRGFRISNADVTLICEKPKVGPHAPAMREALAKILGVEPDRISVKATTSERLGFTGREEGIAAIATATLVSA